MAFEAVVLLAGAGSRMATADGALPKPLVPVGGVPLISYLLRGLAAVGVRKVHAVVGANAEEIVSGLESCLTSGLSLNVIFNSQWQKQNGISVLCAREAVSAPFLLSMGDHLFDPAILRVLLREADHARLNLAIDRRIDAIFDIDDAMKVRTEGRMIVEIGKKLAEFNAIDTGLFLCPAALFDYLEEAKINDDCGLADGVRLMAHDRQVQGVEIGDLSWQDVDTPEMLAQAKELARRLTRGSAEASLCAER